MKTYENVKCDVIVRIKIKKSRFFHVWLFGVDLTMCQLNKRPIIFVMQYSELTLMTSSRFRVLQKRRHFINFLDSQSMPRHFKTINRWLIQTLLLLTCFSSLLRESGWLRAYQNDYVIYNNVEPAAI